MAVIPMLLDIAEELSSPLTDEFGLGICPRDLLQFDYHSLHRLRLLPKNRKSPYTLKKINRNNKIRHIGKDGFQISVDVQQFKPNEITVKTVDNTVVIEGKHEEREDEHGIISRHFLRKCTLPKDYDPNAVTSTLSSDGILTVKAPSPPEKKVKSIERVIEIHQTGPACDSIKDNRKESEEENESNGAVEK